MIDALRFYRKLVSKEMQRFFIYRVNIITACLAGILMLVARYALWLALFSSGNVTDVTFSETITFFVINDVILIWLFSNYGSTIGADIKSGDIALRLVRPFPYHLQLISSFHADALATTLFRALPMLLIAIIFIGVLPPISTVALLIFLLATVLGAIIFSLIDLIISYSAFWLKEYWYLSWFKQALFILFGGFLVPLWFYPEWLRRISEFLPFQFTLFIPIEIYLGRIPANNLISVVGMQLFWIALLFIIERSLWKLAQHKLVVQGG